MIPADCINKFLLISTLLASAMAAFVAILFQCGGGKKAANKKNKVNQARKGGEQHNKNYSDYEYDWKWKQRQLLLQEKKQGANVKSIPQPQSPPPAIPEESFRTETTQNTKTDVNPSIVGTKQQRKASHEDPAKCVLEEDLYTTGSSMESREDEDVITLDSEDDDARTDSTWKHEDNSHYRQRRSPSKYRVVKQICIWSGEKDSSRCSEADDELTEGLLSTLQQTGSTNASSTHVDDNSVPERSGSLDTSSFTSVLSTSLGSDHHVQDSWEPNDDRGPFCQCPSPDDPVKLLSNRPLEEASMKQRLRPIDVPTFRPINVPSPPVILQRDRRNEVNLMQFKRSGNRPMMEELMINAPRRSPPAAFVPLASNHPMEVMMKSRSLPVQKPFQINSFPSPPSPMIPPADDNSRNKANRWRSDAIPVPPKQSSYGGYTVRQYGINDGKTELITQQQLQQNNQQQSHAKDSPQLESVRRLLEGQIKTFLTTGKNPKEAPGEQFTTSNVKPTTWANRVSNLAANQVNRPKQQKMSIPMPPPPPISPPKKLMNHETQMMM